MKAPSASLLFLLLGFLPAALAASDSLRRDREARAQRSSGNGGGARGGSRPRGREPLSCECTYVERSGGAVDDDGDISECRLDGCGDGSGFYLSLSPNLAAKLRARGAQSGRTKFFAPGTVNYDTDTLETPDIDDNNDDELLVTHVGDGNRRADETEEAPFRRKLASATTTGTKTVLVVRASPLVGGSGTTHTEAELANAVFGIVRDGETPDPVNLRSQYLACSRGQLEYVPSAGNNSDGGYARQNASDIHDGVTTVVFDDPVPGTPEYKDYRIKNSITDALKEKFNVLDHFDLADHLMYCIPPDAGVFSAYAYYNDPLSVYPDGWCIRVSVQMHEFGHNMNFRHAYEDKDPYGDGTGTMGSTPEGNIRKCFNGANSWRFGWYGPQTYTVNLATTPSYSGRLYGVADYAADANNPPIVIRLDATSGADDHYVAFNRRVGMNADTEEAHDQVLVTNRTNGTGPSKTYLVAKLGPYSSFDIVNFDGSNQDLNVHVGAIELAPDGGGPGYAEVEICFDCSAPPTHPPTHAPTPAPTCGLAKVGDGCVDDPDCCSGSCSGGNKNNRVCLGGTPEPAPGAPTISAPIQGPPPAPSPGPGGGSCAVPCGGKTKEECNAPECADICDYSNKNKECVSV